jgi:hypothetical protein
MTSYAFPPSLPRHRSPKSKIPVGASSDELRGQGALKVNATEKHDRRPETAQDGPPDGGLPARQESAALALASGLTLAEAARRGKVGTTTLKRWNREPPFARRVSELRAEMTARALGRLVESMSGAADTLGFLARKAKQEAVRLAAARAVLELGTKLRESVELEERIIALESNQSRRVS